MAGAYSSLQAHVDKGRLAYAMKRVQELVRKLEGQRGAIVDQLRKFLSESLGRTAADEAELQATWLLVRLRFSRAAATSSNALNFGETRKLIEMVFSAAMVGALV